MHGSAERALRAELERLRGVLSCVTPQVLQLRPVGTQSRRFAQHREALRVVTLGADSVDLRGGLHLTADQWLRPVEDRDLGGWRIHLAGYLYALDFDDGEVISFHWHPRGRISQDKPHRHVPGWLGKAHVPTGSSLHLAQVLRFAVTELDVEPARKDWNTVLLKAERAQPDRRHERREAS